MDGACGCLRGLAGLLRPPQDHQLRRRDFEETVAFLASVPLFRTQLPRSELPKVAVLLVQKVWQPGQQIVKQGEIGRAFFLVQSGSALVVTRGSDEVDQVRAQLCRGDYWGGHTMLSERPNIGTVRAGEGESLVTLSMSRTAFDEAGLRRWLHFPKRPAIHSSRREAAPPKEPKEQKAPQEHQFIRSALARNVNLRALLQTSEDRMEAIATAADRREVPRGEVVARRGELSGEFFVVREGSFEIVLEGPEGSGGQSAEAAVGHSTMAERLLRKQQFLKQLTQPGSQPTVRNSALLPSQFAPTAGTSGSRSVAPSSFLDAAPGKRVQSKQPRQGNVGLKPRQPEPEPEDAHVLSSGDSFGELALLYNLRREATFRAREDSVVYVVSRCDFSALASVNGQSQRVKEHIQLLDEVQTLTALLSTERAELARNAVGIIDFKPGERILTQGKRREALLWYVVAGGGGIQHRTRPGPDGQPLTVELARLQRGCHFGEFSLLRGDASSQTGVDAGPEGMACLAINAEDVRQLLGRLFGDGETDGMLPSLKCGIEEYVQRLTCLWERRDSSENVTGRRNHAVELSSLRKVCMLGKGGFARVSLVEDVQSSQRYALKVMSKGYIQKLGAEQQISWERELLTMVDSPFVVQLHKTYVDDEHLYFLLEAALGGNLVELLHTRPEIFQEDAPRGSTMAFYCACLISALEHLHERCIVHRDLKPENALLDERGYAKLCDMGFARFVLGKTNTLAGTPDYMPPEMIDFPHSHDMSVDWWALGVLAFELLAGQTPWSDEGLSEPMARLLAIRRSQEQRVNFPFHFPHAARGFITQLLQKLPHRLGSQDGAPAVRQHAMWTSLRFDFEAFHAMKMRTPYSKEWWAGSSGMMSDDLGMDFGFFGLQKGDSIFAPFQPQEQEGGRCSRWDAQFA